MHCYFLAFSAALLIPPIHLVMLGVLGMSTNPALTGIVYGAPIAAMTAAAMPLRAPPRTTAIDAAFAVFLLGALISAALRFDAAHTKEYVLLLLSCAAFVAGRLLPMERGHGAHKHVLWAAAIVVSLGLGTTAPELWRVSHIHLARPQVMGFPHAATLFAYATGVLLLAFVASPCQTLKRPGGLWLGLIAAATLIFALALIRFTFVAAILTVSTLWLVWLLRLTGARVPQISAARLGSASLVVVGALATAVLMRPSVWTFAQMALVDDPGQLMQNSVQMRILLLQDALMALPDAGWFGYGLGAFQARLSRLPGFSPHVSILQAAVEFGWLSGFAFLVLLILPLRLLFDRHPVAPLIGSLFLFTALIGFAHGNISRDFTFFLLLGASSALCSISRVPVHGPKNRIAHHASAHD